MKLCGLTEMLDFFMGTKTKVVFVNYQACEDIILKNLLRPQTGSLAIGKPSRLGLIRGSLTKNRTRV